MTGPSPDDLFDTDDARRDDACAADLVAGATEPYHAVATDSADAPPGGYASATDRPTRIEQLRHVPADARRWARIVRTRAGRRWTDRLAARLALAVVVTLFVGLLGRAVLVDSPVRDHSGELQRLGQQLLEERARGERLTRHLRSLDAREEVREHAIRSELGMLREGERFVTFD